MSDLNCKYLQLLLIELDDLHGDLDMLVDAYKKEKADNKISNYVFMENLALLHNEIIGIRLFHDVVDNLKTQKFASLEELICRVKSEFNKKMHENGIAAALNKFIDKKLDKVEKFIRE